MPIVFEGVGDIFKSSSQVITAPVNTVGVMGKGLALAFKQLYPDLFPTYQHLCSTGELAVGVPWLHQDECSGRDILLFPTKEHWYNPSRLEWIEAGLGYIALTYKELGIHSLALPALGCGNGQLDYLREVRPAIYKYLDDTPIDVEVYVDYSPF